MGLLPILQFILLENLAYNKKIDFLQIQSVIIKRIFSKTIKL